MERLLGELLDTADLPYVEARYDGGQPAMREVAVTGIEFDSRRVTLGSLFCCVPGDDHDGHDFAPQAVASGAAALL